MKKSTSFLPVFIIVLLVLCGCLILVLTGAGFAVLKFGQYLLSQARFTPNFQPGATSTPFQITRQPADQIQTETLNLLEQIIIPENDVAELACRFKSICDVPPTLQPPANPYSTGAQQTFWVNNDDTRSYF